MLETSGESGMVMAKALGISDTILYRWRKEMRAAGGASFPEKGQHTELEEEVRRQEREMLKRPPHGFAPPPLWYEFVDQHQKEFPVSRMGQVLAGAESC